MEQCKFPEDIVVGILCCLPKKSQARFKCVCKQWLSLISDPNRVFLPKTHVGLVCHCRDFILPHFNTISFLRLDPEGGAFLDENLHIRSNIPEKYNLVCSFDGFLLFSIRISRVAEYVVSHPTTQRSWNLLGPPKAYEITNPSLCVGLAPNGDHPHFKVVRIFYGHFTFAGHPMEMGFQVYSSRTGEWVEVKLPPPSFLIKPVSRVRSLDPSASVFVGGALHWTIGSYLLICHLDDPPHFEWINLPRTSGPDQNHCIWELEGCLNYCNVSTKEGRIVIWSLHAVNSNSNSEQKKYSFRWKVKHNGILAPPIMENPRFFLPAAFNDEFAIVYLIHRRRVFSYNLATQEMKVAYASLSAGGPCFGRCSTFPFSSINST